MSSNFYLGNSSFLPFPFGSLYVSYYSSNQKDYASLNHPAAHLRSLPNFSENKRSFLATSPCLSQAQYLAMPAGGFPVCWPRVPKLPDALRVKLFPGSSQLYSRLFSRLAMAPLFFRSVVFNSGNITKFVPFGVAGSSAWKRYSFGLFVSFTGIVSNFPPLLSRRKDFTFSFSSLGHTVLPSYSNRCSFVFGGWVFGKFKPE